MVALRPKLLASKLSETQARLVLHTIRFPGFEDAQASLTTARPAPTLRTLSTLQIHFLLTFPFEALAMNYEPSAHMSCSLSDIFSRFVEQRVGGGYCLQVNALYREVLSFLGYRWLGVLGRVYSPVTGEWSGLTHTASLVYLESHLEAGTKVYYLSDVGFGSSPHRPILLADGREEFGRGSEKFRVVARPLQPRSTFEQVEDEHVDAQVTSIGHSQNVWVLQQSKRSDAGEADNWQDCYSFSTLQCFDPDYDASNKATSHAASVPFATMILVLRYLLHPALLPSSPALLAQDALDERLYIYHPSVVEQRMIVHDKYIVKVGDQVKVNRRIQTEEERVRLLNDEFGLLRHVDARQALETISGKPSSLKRDEEVEKPVTINANNGSLSDATLPTETTAH